MRRAGQLFGSYHSACWYFELVELARKLMLTGLLVFVDPGGSGQVAAGVLVAFLSVLLHVRLSPYSNDGVDFGAQAALLDIFLLLFGGLLLKVRTVDADDSAALGTVFAASCMLVLMLPLAIAAASVFSPKAAEAA